MKFDKSVPKKLLKEQKWFGSIISRPIDSENQMMPISPSGVSMVDEAALYISPGPCLLPHERIQIYNQQYWWRLLNSLRDSFPILSCIFGQSDFNEKIGKPYLQKYYPDHWALAFLGNRLPDWIEEEYHGSDKALVWNAALADCAFINSFLAVELTPLDPKVAEDEEKMTSTTLYLQPHVILMQLPYDIFLYRLELRNHDYNYWQENGVPPLKEERDYYFCLFRTTNWDISWKEVSEIEFKLLEQFSQGASIDSVCSWLELQGGDFFDQALTGLQEWFREWTIRGWLSEQNPATLDTVLK